jgi:aspartate ammonia-lyase
VINAAQSENYVLEHGLGERQLDMIRAGSLILYVRMLLSDGENVTVLSNYRIEKDLLGEVQVPHAALWGAQTQRAVQNFPISGMRPYLAFVWAQTMIKRAAAEVNQDLGLFGDKQIGDQVVVASEIAQAIMCAADEVLAGQWHDHFVVDPFQAGAGTSMQSDTGM